MGDVELLPCPFCGERNLIIIGHGTLRGDQSVLCGTCKSSANSESCWNTRADLHQQALDRIEQLEAQIKEQVAAISQACLIIEEFAADNKRLQQDSQAVVDRWDTPLWKEAEATGHVINRLRATIAQTSIPKEKSDG